MAQMLHFAPRNIAEKGAKAGPTSQTTCSLLQPVKSFAVIRFRMHKTLLVGDPAPTGVTTQLQNHQANSASTF